MQETIYRFPVPRRIALLSDIHNAVLPDLRESLETHKPELILIPGDLFFYDYPSFDRSILDAAVHVLPFLRLCAQTAPSFFSLGNHDGLLTQQDYTVLRDLGIAVLDNSWIKFDDICIGGLSSTAAKTAPADRAEQKLGIFRHNYFRNPEMPVPELAWLDEFTAQDGYKILLCHHPEYRDPYLRDRNIDLIVSGHAHGGQIRLFGRGLYAPGQGWLPKYTAGICGNMIISRGLANTGGIIPRLFNPCEIVYIENT